MAAMPGMAATGPPAGARAGYARGNSGGNRQTYFRLSGPDSPPPVATHAALGRLDAGGDSWLSVD